MKTQGRRGASWTVLVFVGILGCLVGESAEGNCSRAVHTFCGMPDEGDVLVRQGYLLSYDTERRVPRWVAYKITPDFLKTPKREGRFASIIRDQQFDNPVVTGDYTHLEARRGYVRGHLAPYKVMGGDRDADGQYADLDPYVSDPEEELTIRQANQMSNIAPQHDDEFNGPGGLWGKLERWIQDDVVEDEEKTVWVVSRGPSLARKF